MDTNMTSVRGKGRFLFGLFLIIVVAALWSGSSIVLQHIYCDLQFKSAIFVTMVGSALISLYLPIYVIMEKGRWKKFCRCAAGDKEGQWVTVVKAAKEGLSVTEGRQDSTEGSPARPRRASAVAAKASEEERTFEEDKQSTKGSLRLNGNGDDDPCSSLSVGEQPSAVSIKSNSIDHDHKADEDIRSAQVPPTLVGGHLAHMRSAMVLTPILLMAKLGNDLSLKWTSVTSVMVLSSTSAVFAFVFAVIAKDELFTRWKAAAVVLCVLGTIITAIADSGWGESDQHVCETVDADIPVLDGGEEQAPAEIQWRLLGDFAGLVSAAGYGAYTAVLRLRCPDDGSVSMELLFGYMGLFNTIVLAPAVLGGWHAGSIDLSRLSWVVLGFIFLAGLLNDVVAEYLWARSIVLTSATIANVGLSLTVPMAFASDWFLGRGQPTALSLFGALMIIAGFFLITMPSQVGDGRRRNDGNAMETEKEESGDDEVDASNREEQA